MAGYCGYSMSNNAVEAYRSGEKPKSKWTKREIIEEVKRQIEEDETELDVSLSDIEKMPVVALRDLALHEASWHHTSPMRCAPSPCRRSSNFLPPKQKVCM